MTHSISHISVFVMCHTRWCRWWVVSSWNSKEMFVEKCALTFAELKNSVQYNLHCIRCAKNFSPKFLPYSPKMANSVLLALELSYESTCQILCNDPHYHPFKLPITQSLKPTENYIQKSFAETMVDKIDNNGFNVKKLLMNDEVHFLSLLGSIRRWSTNYSWKTIAQSVCDCIGWCCRMGDF